MHAFFDIFNAAGAHDSGTLGEFRKKETHLIPVLLNSVKSNKKINIYGDDYETPDGTCLRDYVHVMDLVEAHFLSFNFILKEKGFSSFNLGSGKGNSILDVIKSCEKITKKNINFHIKNRRLGDPAMLIANNKLAISSLGWKLKFSSIDRIIESAWNWHKENR